MTADNASMGLAAADKGLLARHPLVFYFLIAYAGTWLVLVPVALSEDGFGLLPFSSPVLGDLISGSTLGDLGPYLVNLNLLLILGFFLGPFLSAFIMTGATAGRAGIRRLLRRFVLWRVGFRWYLFTFIGVPAIMVLGTVVLPGALASFETIPPLLAPLPLLSLFVVQLDSIRKPSG